MNGRSADRAIVLDVIGLEREHIDASLAPNIADLVGETRAEERIREVATVAVDEIQQTTERMREDLQTALDQDDVETTEDDTLVCKHELEYHRRQSML